MCITASYFWLTILLKLNFTMDLFPPSFTNLARTVISHNTLECLLLITPWQYLLLNTAVIKSLGKLSKIQWRIASFTAQKLRFSIKDFFRFFPFFLAKFPFCSTSRVCFCNKLLSTKRKSRKERSYRKK